jgi:N-acetylmuramoyl-L-alanine amidase
VIVAVVIGHRASAQGASHGGVTEWAWNGPVAALVADGIRRLGHDPVVVQRNDVRGGYAALPGQINAAGPDCILSLHLNAAGPSATGSETLCWYRSTASQRLADEVQSAMVAALELPDRGTKRRGFQVEGTAPGPMGRREADAIAREQGGRVTYQRGGPLLYETAAPCVIVEPGFLTSADDMARLNERREEYASALADAAVSFLES